jgi:hypothetical protein
MSPSSDRGNLGYKHRGRVLHAVRTRPIPVSQLASELKRDRQAVMRDVRLLDEHLSRRRAVP